MITPRLAKLLPPLALLLVTALVYLPGLSGGFIFDDFPNIITNPAVHATELGVDSLKRAATAYEPGEYGRPLATMTFAVDYAISGKDPISYKISSLLVHLANSLLVYLLALRLFGLPQADTGKRTRPWMALGVATLWAIHPLQASTVLYVVQRMETLASTFVLLALLAYLRGRRLQMIGERGLSWLIAALLLAGIGMLSKETAILAAGFALVLELTLLGFAADDPRSEKAIKAFFAVSCTAAVLVFFLYIVPKHAMPETFAGRDFTMYERVLSQLRILPMHIAQILLPIPSELTFYYDDFAKSTGWISPWTTLAGALFLALLLIVAWRVRRRMPLVSFGILWFFVAHSLTSSVLNLELVFEHRNYLALFGIVVAVADIVHRTPMRDGPALKVFASFMVIALFGTLGAIRSATWGDPFLLAGYLVAVNPDSERAANDLGTIYFSMADGNPKSPFFTFGLKEFERASVLHNASPLPEHALILMAASTGQPVDPAWWDRLIAKLRTRPLGPEEHLALNGLMEQHNQGIALDVERLSEANQARLERKQWPGHMYARYADFALRDLHDADLAERMFVKAVSADPDNSKLAMEIVSNLMVEGHPGIARTILEQMEALGHPLAPMDVKESLSNPE